MNLDFFLAIFLFCFASCATPGPNNLMLLASGVNFGFKRTLPHMMGINFGFGVMVFLVGLGLAKLFDVYPALHAVMKWGSIAFMLYLSWKIATAAAPDASQATSDKASTSADPALIVAKADSPAGVSSANLLPDVVLVVDDAQWAEPALLDLLDHLLAGDTELGALLMRRHLEGARKLSPTAPD